MMMAFNVTRISLLCLLVAVSMLMTIAAVNDVLVRGRELSALSLAMLSLAVTWDVTKYALLHAGHRLCASAIGAERAAGRLAMGVGIAMTFASIMCVATSARAALEPTPEERGDAQAISASNEAANERTSMMREYDALVSSGQLTRARELRAEMRSNEQATPSNEIVRDSTQIVRGDILSKYSVFVWIGCLLLGALIELAAIAMVLVGPLKKPALPAVTTSTSRVTKALPVETIHEELRTGVVQPTVAAVRVRMGCGTARASGVLKEARARGYVGT